MSKRLRMEQLNNNTAGGTPYWDDRGQQQQHHHDNDDEEDDDEEEEDEELRSMHAWLATATAARTRRNTVCFSAG